MPAYPRTEHVFVKDLSRGDVIVSTYPPITLPGNHPRLLSDPAGDVVSHVIVVDLSEPFIPEGGSVYKVTVSLRRSNTLAGPEGDTSVLTLEPLDIATIVVGDLTKLLS